MKAFRTTYLYVKTHNVTGLKYFGKTTKDPYKYLGSGLYWLRHLKEHGRSVSTWIVGKFDDPDLCSKIAIEFSKTNNIVQSRDWANCKTENGLDGGFCFDELPLDKKEELRRKNQIAGKMGAINSQRSWLDKYGCKSSFERLKNDPIFVEKRAKKPADHQKGASNSQHGTIWITNGTNNRKCKSTDLIPDSYWKGRTYKPPE